MVPSTDRSWPVEGATAAGPSALDRPRPPTTSHLAVGAAVCGPVVSSRIPDLRHRAAVRLVFVHLSPAVATGPQEPRHDDHSQDHDRDDQVGTHCERIVQEVAPDRNTATPDRLSLGDGTGRSWSQSTGRTRHAQNVPGPPVHERGPELPSELRASGCQKSRGITRRHETRPVAPEAGSRMWSLSRSAGRSRVVLGSGPPADAGYCT